MKDLLRGRPHWTTSERLVEKEFGVSLSEDRVRRILRQKLHMHLVKPYPQDYRRPEEAEGLLAERLQETFQRLGQTGYKDQEIAIGYVDESSPQPTANTVRVWTRPVQKNTSRMRANSIGFYLAG